MESIIVRGFQMEFHRKYSIFIPLTASKMQHIKGGKYETLKLRGEERA